MVIEINTNTLGTVHINQYTPKFIAGSIRSHSDTNNTKGNKPCPETERAWYDVMPTPLYISLAWPDPTRKEGSGPMPNMDLYRAVST